MNMKFFRCPDCGSIVAPFAAAPCHGEEVVPKTADYATEKHVPVVEVSGSQVTVTVGSTAHPMMDNHYIEWICLETEQGFQVKRLQPGDAPTAVFALTDGDKVVSAYEKCNLHGLWKN